MDIDEHGLPARTWSYDEFRAYLLMYAAYCDRQLDDEEYDAVCDEVGGELARKAKQLIDRLGDEDATNLLLSFKKEFFPTKRLQNRLFEDMEVIFHADGRFCNIEKAAARKLKEQIDQA